MPTISLRRLLGRLAAIALSSTAGPAMADVDENATTGRFVRGGDDDEPTRDRGHRPSTHVLPGDPRSVIDDEELDAALALDLRDGIESEDAAIALGRGLALAMQRMRPIEAMHVASTWSLSADTTRRLAVAHSLEWEFPLPAHDVVLDHLSRDPGTAVRAATARAAVARGTDEVIDRLAADTVPEVREIARTARR